MDCPRLSAKFLSLKFKLKFIVVLKSATSQTLQKRLLHEKAFTPFLYSRMKKYIGFLIPQ